MLELVERKTFMFNFGWFNLQIFANTRAEACQELAHKLEIALDEVRQELNRQKSGAAS